MEIDRRSFMKSVGGAAVATRAMALPVFQPAEPPLPQRLIPADKGISAETLAALRERGERRVYRGRSRFALGMPIGGICAGQVYLLGDGTLGEWRVDGRHTNTGYGSECYLVREHRQNLRQGFALRTVDPAGATRTAIMADPSRGGAYDAVEFIGEYPVAEVRYLSSAPGAGVPPVRATLRAYSPFCPLNARESATPCIVLRWTLENSSGSPLDVSFSGWLQNGVEMGDAADEGPVSRRNAAFSEPGLRGVLMRAAPPPPGPAGRPDRVLADFESGSYAGWTSEGTAFGDRPAHGTEPDQNPVTGFDGAGLVNSFRGGQGVAAGDAHIGTLTSDEFVIDRRFLAFLIGGGGHAGRTCMNLLVDGAVVRSSAGRNDEKLAPRIWDVGEFEGQSARLQIVDAASGAWGHVNVDQIRLTDDVPEGLRRPRPDSLGFGTMCLALLDDGRAGAWSVPHWAGSDGKADLHAARAGGDSEALGEQVVGICGARFTLAPGESRELTFLVSWHFPNLHTGNGVMYSNWFDDALAVARWAAQHDARLQAQTELFRRTYYDDTSLPWWLALRLMMPTANLATGTCQWWKNGRFWGWEGVGCCHGTCAHVWNYAHAEARLFPELARSVREMQDLGTAFDPQTGRVAFRGEVGGGFEYAGDAQAGTVLKCYREHLTAPGDAFLTRNWDRIRRVIGFLLAKDTEAGDRPEPDGVIEGRQHNTFDIDFVGANTFVGSLYHAALLAGERMATLMHDHEFARTLRRVFEAGRDWTQRHLFNGRYFIQRVPPGESLRWQYADGCLTDQLFGQNWAKQVGLGGLYDDAMIRAAYASIYRYNWAPAVGVFNDRFPPERWFARDREGGLFVCTWPDDNRPAEPVRYRDEVWTGCEYQAAAGMAWEGLVDEALVIVKAIDERYDGVLHNPWNEVECGDHYARAMASWGVYHALAGFDYDGPGGRIGLDPRLSPERFAGFFAAAEGWGHMSQSVEPPRQGVRFEVRWGRVRLHTVSARMLADRYHRVATAASTGAVARAQGRDLPCRVEDMGDGRLLVRLERPVELQAGDALEVTFTW